MLSNLCTGNEYRVPQVQFINSAMPQIMGILARSEISPRDCLLDMNKVEVVLQAAVELKKKIRHAGRVLNLCVVLVQISGFAPRNFVKFRTLEFASLPEGP